MHSTIPWSGLAAGAIVLGLVGCRCGGPSDASDPAPVEAAPRPNVLLVVLDTVRADRLSALGHDRPTSPRLDALAGESAWFTRAVSPGMWTLPSHASLFTGLPIRTHGVEAHHKWLDHRFTTLAEILRDAGYATWLLSANPFLQQHTNLTQGYETTLYPWRPPLVRGATAHTRGKIHPDDASNSLGPKWTPGPSGSGRRADQAKDLGPVAARALGRWVEAQDGPWFATVNLMEAHTPRVPSEASRQAITSDPEERAAQLALDQSDGLQLAHMVGLDRYEPDDLSRIGAVYDASVRDADAALGAIVDRLSDLGVLDDTVLVVTSDHGEHLGEHGLLGHKFSVYQPLVHVPLLIRWPEAIEARTHDGVVSTASVLATVLARLNLPVPVGADPTDLVADPSPGVAWTELRRATPRALTRLQEVHPAFDPSPWLRTWVAVQEGDRRCLRRSDGHLEVYDVARDPLETTPLDAGEPASRALCARLDAWEAATPVYDPTQAGPDDPKTPTLPEGTRQQLEALGYVDP